MTPKTPNCEDYKRIAIMMTDTNNAGRTEMSAARLKESMPGPAVVAAGAVVVAGPVVATYNE